MLWPVLIGKTRTQPAIGHWHDWKQDIADHCGGQCVYCAIHEARFGGIRNFHVEHFRPKKMFSALEDDINNLFLACGICNVLKSDDWPGEPAADHSVETYADPAVTDYNTFLVVSPLTNEVSAPSLSGKYVIERLLLNRAQLIIERRLAATLVAFSEFEEWAESAMASMTKAELRSVSAALLAISRTKTTMLQNRAYRDVDTKRVVKAKGGKKR